MSLFRLLIGRIDYVVPQMTPRYVQELDLSWCAKHGVYQTTTW